MSQSPPLAPASVASLLASLMKPPGATAASTPGSTPPNAATPAGCNSSAAATPNAGNSSAAATPSAGNSSAAAMAPLRVVRREPAADCAGFAHDMHPVLKRIYAARGIRSPAQLDSSLDRLHPVGTLEGIPAAVDLLLEHRANGKILVVGDFDADGATSTALMIRALNAWGFASVDFLVPNRFEFGYGLTPEIVALAATRSPTLIVTVDNGISSLTGVVEARSRGIAVLITDHHLPGSAIPAANVIVNPNLPGQSVRQPCTRGRWRCFLRAWRQ